MGETLITSRPVPHSGQLMQIALVDVELVDFDLGVTLGAGRHTASSAGSHSGAHGGGRLARRPQRASMSRESREDFGL